MRDQATREMLLSVESADSIPESQARAGARHKPRETLDRALGTGWNLRDLQAATLGRLRTMGARVPCAGISRNGKPCGAKAEPGHAHCKWHLSGDAASAPHIVQSKKTALARLATGRAVRRSRRKSAAEAAINPTRTKE